MSSPMSSPMSEQLVSPVFLFRFSVPCRYRHQVWGPDGVQLESKYRVPSFRELEGNKLFADLRVAWNKEGLAFDVRVVGKARAPWCRDTRPADSDGLHVWIDTRDTHNIHRASRFCHRFAFLPRGTGAGGNSPLAQSVPINRAKEPPNAPAPSTLRVRSEKRATGYALEAFVPAAALNGYDPDEYPRLGFSYAVIDHELGWQTFSVGPELPFMEDPSLWGTLELA
ncbi:MAG: hypothetical protein ACQESR_14470 [Planctomycetota bacterium]